MYYFHPVPYLTPPTHPYIIETNEQGRRYQILSIQFIAGGSGCGKSHYIYEKIIQESMEHPERNYLVIVPEQFTMVTEKELASLLEDYTS